MGSKAALHFMILATCIAMPPQADATDIFDSLSRCTNTNCASVQLGGVISGRPVGDASAYVLPWTFQAWASANSCLRLDVTAQDIDLAIRVVAPDPQNTWFNDNGGGPDCADCPRLDSREAS